MEAGTLVLWHVHPGDTIKRGDIIADIETEKGIIEVEVFEDGIVDQLLVQPGQEVPVGTVMALLRSAGAPAPAGTAETTTGSVQASSSRAERRIRVSPLARRLATEQGVDLSTVHGTGPEGAIERVDVERAAAALTSMATVPPPAMPITPVTSMAPATVAPSGMRRAIAAAMARSKREIPHYYLQTSIDMSRALRWLEAENRQRSIKDRLLPAVLLIKAVARALGAVPALNGYWLDDRPQPQEAVHICFAIALRQGGLIAPAMHHVDLKGLDEIMEALRDLITRVRAGRLRSSEMTDATITVTSLGELGVETVYGVIYPPQVALVGFGKIHEQPWAEQGMLGVRPVLSATLSADHRATDGSQGARFLDALNRALQEPATL
jgi:pyruvate dehydrogenase E2 component (dihydrolipoamide acetyltransferase)